jgi:hypothetical protein
MPRVQTLRIGAELCVRAAAATPTIAVGIARCDSLRPGGWVGGGLGVAEPFTTPIVHGVECGSVDGDGEDPNP